MATKVGFKLAISLKYIKNKLPIIFSRSFASHLTKKKVELCTVKINEKNEMECLIYNINQIDDLLKAEGVYKGAPGTNNEYSS